MSCSEHPYFGGSSYRGSHVWYANCHVLDCLKARFSRRPFPGIQARVNWIESYIDRLKIINFPFERPFKILNFHSRNTNILLTGSHHFQTKLVLLGQISQNGKDGFQIGKSRMRSDPT
jgi:hypothetical protein